MSYVYLERAAEPGYESTFKFEMLKSKEFDIYLGVATFKTLEKDHDKLNIDVIE